MKVSSDKMTNVSVQAAVIFVSCMTAAMNFRYGMSLGSDDMEKYMLAGTGLAFDVIKFLGLAYAVNAFRKKARVKAVLAFFGWGICVLYSMNAALGFATMARSHMIAHTQFEISQDAKQKKDQEDTVRQVKAKYQEKFNTLTAKNAEFEKMKDNPRFASTTACSVPETRMTNESIFFCRKFYMTSLEIKDMKAEVEKAEIEMNDKLASQPKLPEKFHADPDPLMTFYSKWFGIPLETLVTIWAVAIAVMLELIASVGNYAFSPTRLKPIYRQREEVQEEVIELPKRRGRSLGSKNKPKLHVVG